MASLGLKLPIQYSSTDGFQMLKSFQRLLHQNFKMLLLTNPGERVMAPTFGVGMRMYLFENAQGATLDNLRNKIYEQTATYIPAIQIHKIDFSGSDFDANQLSVTISYSIPALNIRDLIAITI